jgi:hypothetical protein
MNAGTLQDLVAAKIDVTERMLASVALSVLSGLAEVHASKQIHRDIKPSNILLDRDGGIKISDFGIARKLEHSVSMASTFTGTLTYMSPERISGQEYSYPSDIWSLGVCLATLALGRYPYPTQSGYWGVVQAIQDSPCPDVAQARGYGRELQAFIASCLAKDPALRPTAKELLGSAFLDKYVRGEGSARAKRSWWAGAAAKAGYREGRREGWRGHERSERHEGRECPSAAEAGGRAREGESAKKARASVAEAHSRSTKGVPFCGGSGRARGRERKESACFCGGSTLGMPLYGGSRLAQLAQRKRVLLWRNHSRSASATKEGPSTAEAGYFARGVSGGRPPEPPLRPARLQPHRVPGDRLGWRSVTHASLKLSVPFCSLRSPARFARLLASLGRYRGEPLATGAPPETSSKKVAALKSLARTVVGYHVERCKPGGGGGDLAKALESMGGGGLEKLSGQLGMPRDVVEDVFEKEAAKARPRSGSAGLGAVKVKGGRGAEGFLRRSRSGSGGSFGGGASSPESEGGEGPGGGGGTKGRYIQMALGGGATG